ncbi:MAG: type II toxin-antitoxin system PrlF family antitoxin [Rhodobacteraceae bacterium]|nr:type II toxin-antitoxin system PrlF family antitoxin [Paracoccaceae bacterium]MCY4138953.1 type II toxin-antitoxin system PrlF family antitoxin [Paracoccaceae bacterium]
MSIINEVATVTAKGQITLPKSIRHALGVDVGTKVAFELDEDGQVVVSRAKAEHEDPAIGAFLDLLASEIQAGRHVQVIPDDLAQDMLEHARRETGPGEDIEGDVNL